LLQRLTRARDHLRGFEADSLGVEVELACVEVAHMTGQMLEEPALAQDCRIEAFHVPCQFGEDTNEIIAGLNRPAAAAVHCFCRHRSKLQTNPSGAERQSSIPMVSTH
jgi:hypothetical protein